eukprot:4301559-Pleurochrysis_carterae.AAC.4
MSSDGAQSFCVPLQSTRHPACNCQRSQTSSASASLCMQGVGTQPASHQQAVFGDGAGSFCVPVQSTKHPACDWGYSDISNSSPSHTSFATSPPRRLVSVPTGNSEHGMSWSTATQPQMPLVTQMPQGAQATSGATHSAGLQYSYYQPQTYHAHNDVYANASGSSLNRYGEQPRGCPSSGYDADVAIDNLSWPAGHYAVRFGLAHNHYSMHVQSVDGMPDHRMPTSSTSSADIRANVPVTTAHKFLRPVWDSPSAFQPWAMHAESSVAKSRS